MIAVLGASGQLGSAFLRLLGDAAMPIRRTDLDLRETARIAQWVAELRPEVIINCAAYTAVDDAESDTGTARAVNAEAVGELASACRTTNARLVTFSTDYVFDGEKDTGYVESDEPNPLNVYGRTKLEGERLALDNNPSSLVIRTSWLLSATHPNFLTKVLDQLASGHSVSVVDDQRGRPTFVDDLARATMQALRADADGILHVTNQGEATWFELARTIARLAGYDARLARAISSADLSRPAARPANSVLDSERLSSLPIEPLPPAESSLERNLKQMRAYGHRPVRRAGTGGTNTTRIESIDSGR